MNDTKGASETSLVAGDKQQQAKNKQNIREIYLNAVKNNKGFHRRTKKHAIPSLPKSSSEASFNGSAYLEKEYTLVKRIINDTKELKNIKTKGDVSVKSVDVTTTKSSTSVTSRPSTATSASYKTPEEYSQELLELKKTLKIYQDNDVVNKAKFDYYDNELSKKEQEIIDLLENKKIEELRTCSDSKADLIATVYNLKQKTYKLEFSLKRKENELNKLKAELKTTNLKELKAQNERLRLELSKALMNDKKIIEAFEKEGLIERNGYSFYDSERRKAESELSLHKKEKMKENLAQQLMEENFDDENQFQAALKDFKHKMPLKGTLKQKLEILDLRENECLKEIERLNANLEKQSVEEKLKLSSSMSSLRKEQHVSRRDDEDEKLDKKHRSVEKLQSVLRGHMERVNSLNRRQQRSDSSDDDRHSSRQSSGSQQSLLREKLDNRRRREAEAAFDSPPYRDDDRQKRPDSRRRNSSRRPTQIDSSSSSDQSARSDHKIPIDDKNIVSEVETKGGCCSCTKSNKSKKEAKK